MYKVLIADDEPWVAFGLKKLIDWESLGFTVTGEVTNGIKALAFISEMKPEVILSDIRMPGLNGLQLLERLREMQMDCHVILISGYAEFGYAQQAIRLGAYDYLLKQIDKVKLTETLTRLKKSLDEKKKSNQVIDLLLDDLFELFEPDSNVKMQNFLFNRGTEWKDPHFRFISCLYEHKSTVDLIRKQITDQGYKCIQFHTGQYKQSYLLNYDEQKEPSTLFNFITENLSIAQHVGISSIGVYSTAIGRLYQESDIALFTSCMYPEARLQEYKSAESTSLNATDIAKMIAPLEIAIKEQKHNQISKIIDQLYDDCIERQLLIDQISVLYNQIVSLFYKYYSNDFDSEVEYMNYDQIVRSYGSLEQLFEKVKTYLHKKANNERLVSHDTVKKIFDDIKANFTEDITLSSFSKKHNLSIGYLSALFKKETNNNFSDYLVSLRLNLAKELLHDNSLSIHEIVERVGYKDYFHFNKLFKKHFGITPSKYRKL